MCGVYSSAHHGKSPESCLDVEPERWRRLTFIGQNVTRRYKGADGLKIGLTAPDASPRTRTLLVYDVVVDLRSIFVTIVIL